MQLFKYHHIFIRYDLKYRKNIKSVELTIWDDYYLRSRNKIEVLFDLVKEHYNLGTRKISNICEFSNRIYASLSAY